MFLDLQGSCDQNKNESLDKTVSILWSQILETMAEKGPLKTLKKYSKKVPKT